MNRKIMLGVISLLTLISLAACGGNDNMTSENNSDQEDSTENTEMDENSNGKEGVSSDEVPENLTEAKDPSYPVGSKVEINDNHMTGMDGAEATVEGAYDTISYEVTYEPNDGGETVKNHKWVIHEEIKDSEEQSYEKGDEVDLEADHMEGMKNATATIDDSEDTTVYMLSYKDTETGEEVQNHKWVVEDELSSLE